MQNTTPEKTVVITIKEIIPPKQTDNHIRTIVRENVSTYNTYKNSSLDTVDHKSSIYWKF